MSSSRKPAPARKPLDINLDCKELVMDYLQAAFPTRAMEIVSDDDGNERSRPLSDANGNPVHSEEALQIRTDTLELLGAMPPIAPALDAVIEPINEASETLKELAAGNLNAQMVGDYQGDHAIIKEAMNQTIANLKRYVAEITSTNDRSHGRY